MLINYWQNISDLINGEHWGLSLETVKQRHCLSDSRFIEIDGMQVHYRDVGHGPVLLCIHGIFSSLHNWLDWTDILSNEYRVISLDMPNFGITGAHPNGVTQHLYSDFLNAFTAALDIQQCAIAGNSLGGWMSYEFAYRYPEKVSKLILIDSAGFLFIPPMALVGMRVPFAGWSLNHTALPRQLVHNLVKGTYAQPQKLTDTILDRYYDMMRRPGNRQAGTRVVTYIRNQIGFDTSYLEQIQQPTLVMWGKQDKWIPASHLQKFTDRIPGAEAIMYDNCGHLPMEELPQQSAADVRTFLQS